MGAGDRVLAPGHIQFGEQLLLGPGTPYRWRTLSGWSDSPAWDSGTTNRPAGHGAYPGALWAQPRTVTVDGIVIRAPAGRIGAVVGQFEAGAVSLDDELPLVVHLDERGPLMVWARCLRWSVPTGRGYRVGTITGCALQFEAADPRRYSLAEQHADTGLPVDEQGLDWHLDAAAERGLDWHLATPPGGAPPTEDGITFGSGGSTGIITATNAGKAPSPGVLVFTGPVEQPSLVDLRTGRRWEYDITLGAGEQLVVDGAGGTVTLSGSSRLHTVTDRSAPEQLLAVAPGTSDFAFAGAPDSVPHPAARAELRWRHAHW
ncbi:phage distal tail protein [Kitasatospora sp. NPDC001574]